MCFAYSARRPLQISWRFTKKVEDFVKHPERGTQGQPCITPLLSSPNNGFNPSPLAFGDSFKSFTFGFGSIPQVRRACKGLWAMTDSRCRRLLLNLSALCFSCFPRCLTCVDGDPAFQCSLKPIAREGFPPLVAR